MSITFHRASHQVDNSKNLLQIDEGRVIPRIIHQTFMSKNLPAELQENVERIKRLNPGWTHILYDDNDIQTFIRKNYGVKMLSYFGRINPRYGAARADLFRYLVMYKCGGVYLDIKSTCTKPLDEVLQPDDKYILAQWRNKPGENYAGYGLSKEVAFIEGGEYQQWHIVAAPGHPFLKAVIETVIRNIDNYRPWLHGTGGIGVLRLTGPLVYTLAIHPLLASASYRLVNNETDVGLQYSVYTNTHHRSVYKTNYSLLTESIIHMKNFHKILAYLYSFAKKSKHLLFGR
ncbi:glycosyltransferase [uncultured Mucilaginibacter sp.]|uniref:glycosyltransferase family 32 protein n=1 Tax=uncultured Mucilaginibacter sp. TaxID=797541 RepID=UPI0026261883|nr:glycosyltransferase [uncultured Mucilaginibacter sp.]